MSEESKKVFIAALRKLMQKHDVTIEKGETWDWNGEDEIYSWYYTFKIDGIELGLSEITDDAK